MASRNLFSQNPPVDPASVPSQHPHHSSQHDSQRIDRRGDENGQKPEVGHYSAGTSTESQLSASQGQSSAFKHSPDSREYGGQRDQQWQKREPFNYSGYHSPTQHTPQQYPYGATSQQHHNSWSQIYPQYGHINPAFLAQQQMGQFRYPTNTFNGSCGRYGGSYSGFESAYDGRQWSGCGHSNYQANQIPVANSQASAAAAYQSNYLCNTFDQGQPQYYSVGYYANGYNTSTTGGATGAATTTNTASETSAANATYPTKSTNPWEAERYDPRFSHLEYLMNPDHMDSSRLTTPGENPRQYLLPHPKPSESYLQNANRTPRRLSSPKKLLIVLDLNGTLLVRSGRGSKYTPRPFVQEFLAYCLEHHLLVVWSSARPHNVEAMVAQLFTKQQRAKLVKIWSREHLRLGRHYDAKVQVYKQLTWLWEDAEVQTSFPSAPFKVEDGWKEPLPTKWDQSNTVLLDDSVDKAASEPFNLIRVDEFTQENKCNGDDVLGRVLAYIEHLKWEADVSAAMRETPFLNGQGPEWDWIKGERRPSA